jgi:hypothetical protein
MSTPTAAPKWYACTPKHNKRHLYCRKTEGGVVVFDYTATPRTSAIHTADVCRRYYEVGTALDGLTNSQVEAAYRRLTQPALPAITGPAPAGMSGAAKSVANNTVEKIHGNAAAKFSGNGKDANEAQLDQLQKAADGLEHKKFVLVAYDIHDRACPNPAGVFWGYAFPLSESVWAFTTDSLSATAVTEVLAGFAECKVTVDILPQAEETNEAIRNIARRKLAEKLVQLHTSLITRIANAAERLQAARAALDQSSKETLGMVTAKDYEVLDKISDNQVRGIIRGAAEGLEAAITSARLFDAEENVKDLKEALRQAIASEAASFNALMMQKGGKQVAI